MNEEPNKRAESDDWLGPEKFQFERKSVTIGEWNVRALTYQKFIRTPSTIFEITIASRYEDNFWFAQHFLKQFSVFLNFFTFWKFWTVMFLLFSSFLVLFN